MTTKPAIRRPARLWHWAGCAWLLCAWMAQAENLRVAVWDLRKQKEGVPPDQATFLQGAALLNDLNPEVILLQGLPDRDSCLKLAEALKPAGYNLAICSSFGGSQTVSVTDTAKLDELKRTAEARLNVARNDLVSAQRALGERQASVGTLGKQLLAQGALDWPEVPPQKATEYAENTRESDKLRTQERELVRRGYRDTHPLVQTVRTMLRNYSLQRAELERDFPTLKFLATAGDPGTNAAAQETIAQIREIREWRARSASAGITLSNVEFEASRIATAEAQMLAAAKTRREQQKSGAIPSEVAIFSRRKVERTGSGGWGVDASDQSRGGLVFATIGAGRERAILLSATWAEPWVVTNAMTQLQENLSNFKAQQEASTFVIALGGSANSAGNARLQSQLDSGMEKLGFMDCLRDLSSQDKLRWSSGSGPISGLFAGPIGFAFRPQLASDDKLELCISCCEIGLDQSTTLATLPSLGRTSNAEYHNQKPSQRSFLARNWFYLVAGGSVVAGLVLLGHFLRGHQRRSRKLKPVAELTAGSGYTMVLAPKRPAADKSESPEIPDLPGRIETVPITTQTQSASWQHRALAAEQEAERARSLVRQGLLPDLSRWLKQKLVHKLLTDRADLLSAQQVAARQVAAVDERLTRIEAQLQVQNRAYLRRIEELTLELNAAKEENRELIRARIAQVKSEMQAAKEKLLEAESGSAGPA